MYLVVSVAKFLKTIFLFFLIVVAWLFLYYELLVEKYRKHNYNIKLPFPSLLRSFETKLSFRAFFNCMFIAMNCIHAVLVDLLPAVCESTVTMFS